MQNSGNNCIPFMLKLKPPTLAHSWNLTPKEAVILQKQLSPMVVCKPGRKIKKFASIAGVDAHYRNGLATAAVVIINLPDLETVEYTVAAQKADFPYISGLLAFREGPAILVALKKLTVTPDLLIFDGQGIAHPQRFGIASHIGLLVDIPSVGCAKTRLLGQYIEPDFEKGSFTYLTDRGETIGAAVRTRSSVKPVYVSIGHRMDLKDSIKIILQCCDKYRLPEPIRRADKLARKEARSS